jgi:chorismate mutase
VTRAYVLAAVMVALLGALSYVSYRAGANSVLAGQARDEAVMRLVEERAQTGAAKAIAAIKPINRHIHNEVQRETRIVPDYSACQHSAVGLRGVNAALTNQPLAAGGSELP